MKKLILTLLVSISILSASFGQFMQASMSGWPNQLLNPGTVASSATKIVSDGTYYYASTDDAGIYRIARSSIASGTWSAYNNSLPAMGLTSGSLPYYGVMDMEIISGYIYAICWVSGSSTAVIYRAPLSTGVFASVTPSSMVSNHAYAIKAVGSYLYISDINAWTTSDIRYTQHSTGSLTWTTLSLTPGGNIPNGCYSINAVVLGSRWDIHFCCHNGLFVKGSGTTGAPTGGQGFVGALADCPKMDYLYDASGVFTWVYFSQMYTYSPGHEEPATVLRMPTGSNTPTAVTMTPSNTLTGGIGQISSLAAWNGNAHFGVISNSGALSGVLYKGDNTANNFVISNFCGGAGGGGVSGTAGTLCMLSDGTTRLLAGEYSNGVWYTTNVACKTDDATGINDPEQNQIKVFPIPATNELTVTYPSGEEQPTVTLYDLQGRAQNVPVNFSHNGEAVLTTSALSKGVYMLEFNNGSKTTRRVVIE